MGSRQRVGRLTRARHDLGYRVRRHFLAASKHHTSQSIRFRCDAVPTTDSANLSRLVDEAALLLPKIYFELRAFFITAARLIFRPSALFALRTLPAPPLPSFLPAYLISCD